MPIFKISEENVFGHISILGGSSPPSSVTPTEGRQPAGSNYQEGTMGSDRVVMHFNIKKHSFFVLFDWLKKGTAVNKTYNIKKSRFRTF
jgi:hypothetical protein